MERRGLRRAAVRRRLGRDRWARIGSDAIAGERARLAVRRPPTGAIERVLIGGNWCAGARGACPLRGLSFRALPERKPPLPRGQPPRRRGACGPVPHRPRSRRRASGAVDRFPPPTAVPRNRRGTSLCAGGGRCPVSRGRRASVPPVGLRRRGVLGTRCSRTKTQDTVRGTNPPGPYPWALSVPSPGSPRPHDPPPRRRGDSAEKRPHIGDNPRILGAGETRALS
jgi:hypothetical protein